MPARCFSFFWRITSAAISCFFLRQYSQIKLLNHEPLAQGLFNQGRSDTRGISTGPSNQQANLDGRIKSCQCMSCQNRLIVAVLCVLLRLKLVSKASKGLILTKTSAMTKTDREALKWQKTSLVFARGTHRFCLRWFAAWPWSLCPALTTNKAALQFPLQMLFAVSRQCCHWRKRSYLYIHFMVSHTVWNHVKLMTLALAGAQTNCLPVTARSLEGKVAKSRIIRMSLEIMNAETSLTLQSWSLKIPKKWRKSPELEQREPSNTFKSFFVQGTHCQMDQLSDEISRSQLGARQSLHSQAPWSCVFSAKSRASFLRFS